MVSIPKVVGLMSCGVVLGLRLSAVAQAGDAAAAAEDLKRGRTDRAKSEQRGPRIEREGFRRRDSVLEHRTLAEKSGLS